MSTECAEHEISFDVLAPAPEQVATFAQKMRWYARLALAKRDAGEHLDRIKARMTELEPHLIEEMQINGVDRQTVDGMTIFPQSDIHVNKKPEKEGVTTDMVCDALRACGCAYMVSEGFSASSLKSKVREWRSEGIELPEALARVVNVFESTKLVTRAG